MGARRWKSLSIALPPLLAAGAVLADQAGPMTLMSTAFSDGGGIPAQYSCEGPGGSPPLSWSRVPAGTRSLALVVDDPDAPSGDFVHWVLYDLPPTLTGLNENASYGRLPEGAVQGKNGKGDVGWTAPCPPSGTHHYRFVLYALGDRIEGSSAPTDRDLLSAIRGRVLGKAQLVGTFAKTR